MGNQCNAIPNNEANTELDTSKKDSPKEDFPEIIEIIKKIKELEIFERPKIAKEKYNNFIQKEEKNNLNDEEIRSNYIKIYELLLLNDTDKDIVKLYLDFIEKNNNFIKQNKRKTFEEEKNKYKILFNVEEGYKTKSEKDNFIEYLKQLEKSEDYIEVCEKAKISTENIYYFNNPIEFSNKELYYYKFYILLISEIAEQYKKSSPEVCKNYVLQRKRISEMIIEKDIFNIKEIYNNEDKMNLLIILILYDELNDKGESINFNRFLYSDNVNIEQLKNFLEKHSLEIIETKEKGKVLINDKKENLIGKIDINNSICLKNIVNNVYNNYYFFKPIDDLLKKHEMSLYIKKIRTLLIKFIHSNVYTEAIKELFPEHYKILLSKKTLNDLIFFIKKRLKFYPYQNLSNSGLTDKFSLYSYIPVIYPLIGLGESVFSIFKVSSTFENAIHEINHINQGMLFFKSNDTSLINIPKKQVFITGKEGGSNMEEILFGRKILNFTFLEAIYIINEKNFEQNLNDYRKNFLSMRNFLITVEDKNKYLNIKNGIFSELSVDIDKYIILANNNKDIYSMNAKSKNISYIFNITRGKCCMGFK